MSETTAISWADRTWSPWEGCTKVSTAAAGGGGCDNCYAERMNRWLHRGENWGPGAPRLEFSEDHWDKLRRWNDAAAKRGEQPTVFPSMCDPFDNEVRPELRARFFEAVASTPNLRWLILTKRIGNAWKMMADACGVSMASARLPLPNVWLGATVVNQAEADRDIPKLLNVPARVRFLSIEPMLGPIDLQKACTARCPNGRSCFPFRGHLNERCVVDSSEGGIVVECICSRLNGLHWVIAGGESGPHARPMHPDWVRSLRDQCAAAGVPFHFKQWGEWAPSSNDPSRYPAGVAPDGSIVGPDEQFTEECALMYRLGKKAAGRLLDGVEHNGFPT